MKTKASQTVTVVDYGGSNIRSVQKALLHIGAQVRVTDDPHAIAKAEKVVLPGVGAFGAAIRALKALGLDEAIKEAFRRQTPIMGICLGMQLLFERSAELGFHEGLGLLPGSVERFDQTKLKVPHMGWNQLKWQDTHPLLNGLENGCHAYFVHSYHCRPASDRVVVATTDYDTPFPAIVNHANITGLQFHPEKSQSVGLRILDNFRLL